MPEIFELKNIGYSYLKNQVALSNINLAINGGEILSIIGSNGSGKSTLLHILCGLTFATEGNIAFKGEIFDEKSFKNNTFNRHFRSTIGYVFQDPDTQLFCPTVYDEIIFGPLQLGISKEQACSRADELMKMMNISELKNRPPYMLSGGEKKRVAIAAILANNPDILIFDEPMSGLDPKTRSFLIELIYELNKAGKTIIIATHHLEVVNHFQTRTVVLNEKHSIEKIGPSHEILHDTCLLANVNLIGEYPHMHNGTIHKHFQSGFLFHQHVNKNHQNNQS
jgi:cobalt/nickel transport system ATP-binding protein